MNNSIIIDYLRDALHNEINSIHQYFIYHRIMEYKGYNGLAAIFKRISVDEMKHADGLMGRILFLGGDISIVPSAVSAGSGDIIDMIRSGMADEAEAIKLYNKIAATAEESQDYESANLVSGYLSSEEGHYDWFRKQIGIIEAIGIENYITESLKGDPDAR